MFGWKTTVFFKTNIRVGISIKSGVNSCTLWMIFRKKEFFYKIPVLPLMNGLIKNYNFFDNSIISWRILLIFELKLDIHKTSLQKISAWSDVLVKSYRIDGQTHSPILIVDSLFEYTNSQSILIFNNYENHIKQFQMFLW